MKRLFATTLIAAFALTLTADAQARSRRSSARRTNTTRQTTTHRQTVRQPVRQTVRKPVIRKPVIRKQTDRKLTVRKPTNGKRWTIQPVRPVQKHKHYHFKFGKKFKHGFYYFGKKHYHWTKTIFMAKYGCRCHWCPSTCKYYYWCAPHSCYYPVSYCPTGCYAY